MKRFRLIIMVVAVLLLFSAVAYGDSWTTNQTITNTLGDSKYPAIAVDGSNIYVVWQDNTPDLSNEEIYFKRSVDGGVHWKTNKRLTNNAGGSWDPAIAVDGSNIYVVWQDYRLGNPEIYFKRSLDGGSTWKQKRLTNEALGSQYPAIATDGSNVYIVWQNFISMPPNYEIYFKKGILF
jgi:Tol biopolymer transport system component